MQSFSCFAYLLSKRSDHEEDCANFFLRESEFYVLVWSSAYYLIKKCKNLTEIMQLMMKLGYSFSRQFSAKFVVNNVEIYSDYNVPSDPTISSFTERFFYLIYYWRVFLYTALPCS